MIEFERVLTAVDFSEFGGNALHHACHIADRFGAELHLLHVLHDVSTAVPRFGGGLALPAFVESIGERHEELEVHAIKAMNELLAPEWRDGRRVVVATRFGHPWVEIVRYARQHLNDLVVMGTHGRSGLKHVMLGSVAEQVVRHAHCPVLTVRPEGHVFEMP